jgi:hypothetical protein
VIDANIGAQVNNVVSQEYLFRTAWKTARKMAEARGGTARSHFREALGATWSDFRQDAKAQQAHRVARAAAKGLREPLPLISAPLQAAADRSRGRRGGDYLKA